MGNACPRLKRRRLVETQSQMVQTGELVTLSGHQLEPVWALLAEEEHHIAELRHEAQRKRRYWFETALRDDRQAEEQEREQERERREARWAEQAEGRRERTRRKEEDAGQELDTVLVSKVELLERIAGAEELEQKVKEQQMQAEYQTHLKEQYYLDQIKKDKEEAQAKAAKDLNEVVKTLAVFTDGEVPHFMHQKALTFPGATRMWGHKFLCRSTFE